MKLIIKAVKLTTLGVFIVMFSNNVALPAYSTVLKVNSTITKTKDSMRPMNSPDMRRYCSASIIEYKGVNFSVTNRHCCNAMKDIFPKKKRLVGNRMEDVLAVSTSHDICILTADKRDKALKLASKPAKRFQKVMVFGYPRGLLLTPRFGHILQPSEETCILYDDGVKCENGIVTSVLVYPGNSGSPLLDTKGRVVGLIYAGSGFVQYSIAVKLVSVKKALDYAYKKIK